jgi:hypothetical protein
MATGAERLGAVQSINAHEEEQSDAIHVRNRVSCVPSSAIFNLLVESLVVQFFKATIL